MMSMSTLVSSYITGDLFSEIRSPSIGLLLNTLVICLCARIIQHIYHYYKQKKSFIKLLPLSKFNENLHYVLL